MPIRPMEVWTMLNNVHGNMTMSNKIMIDSKSRLSSKEIAQFPTYKFLWK